MANTTNTRIHNERVKAISNLFYAIGLFFIGYGLREALQGETPSRWTAVFVFEVLGLYMWILGWWQLCRLKGGSE